MAGNASKDLKRITPRHLQGNQKNQSQAVEMKPMKLWHLPEEILYKISKYLDPASVKNCRLVAKFMKEVIESSALWSWATLEVNDLNHEEVLASEVVHLVSGIQSSGVFPVPNMFGQLFRALLAGQYDQLVRIFITFTDLRPLEAALFRVVGRIQVCDLSDCRLTESQLSVIFSTIRDKRDLRLTDLDISGVNISSLDPGLLQSMVRLNSCNLQSTRPTLQQVSAIFKALQETPDQDLKLKVLNISSVGVSSLRPGPVLTQAQALIQSVVRLESLTMRNLLDSIYTKAIYISMFKAILETPELKLRTLDLGWNCFVGVPRQILVGAVARLEKVNLSSTELSPSQLCEIFKLAAGRKVSSLLEINLHGMDVQSVPHSLRDEAEKNKKIKIKLDLEDFSEEEDNVEEEMDWNDGKED